MSIFENAPEFVEYDNRRFRLKQSTTIGSLTEKLLVQLPPNLVENKTVLDLGSCLGAAGHHALTHGASFYTGVEIQQYYVDSSRELLNKYWNSDKFEIIQQDVEEFLDIAISQNKKFDYVLAAGVIYGFVDIVNILKKITMVAKSCVMIDTLTVHVTTDDPKSGIILVNEQGMVKGKNADEYSYYSGIGSKIDIKALDIVMSTFGYNRTEGIINPKPIADTHDAYNDPDPVYFKDVLGVEFSAPSRYMVRYHNTHSQVKTVQKIINEDNQIEKHKWAFDDSVADRFQHEAETNIPGYAIVIDKCLQIAHKYVAKTDKIIDIGSALGYTVDKFVNEGFDIIGVDNSMSMINKSLHKERIICSDELPAGPYKLVLMNWTLHFMQDKEKYLKDIYDNIDNGFLILTDKCAQTEITKDLYYDFKRGKGVTEEYIKQKEKNLVGIMHSMPTEWYFKTLRELGFSVDIIHAEYGFVTFICKK